MTRIQQGKNVVGRCVSRARNRRNLTQEGLAVRCQLIGWPISRETLAKIELGFRRVTDVELLLLSLALRTEPTELLPSELAASALVSLTCARWNTTRVFI